MYVFRKPTLHKFPGETLQFLKKKKKMDVPRIKYLFYHIYAKYLHK